MSSLMDALSDVTENMRAITDSIGHLEARQLTAADRTILRTLVDDLESLDRALQNLAQR